MNVDRRNFIGMGLGGIWGAALTGAYSAETPFHRHQPGTLLPGLAAYSFRERFASMKGKINAKVDPAEAMDMKKFIHYCASQGVAAELTSYFFDPEVTDAYLADCRREAHLNGVGIAGTAVGNQFTLDPASPEGREQMVYVKRWIDRAVVMGAPHVRVFAGKSPKGMEEDVGVKHAIAALREAGDYAAEKGILLGIENHDSIGSAEKLITIVESVNNPWVGVNLDSGNFRTEDPYADFAGCVPYAVNIQLKEEISIGEKNVKADLPRLLSMIKKGGYSGYVVLEYEGTKDPFVEVPILLSEIKEILSK